MKREDYISWDEYFMGIAMLAAEKFDQNHWHVRGSKTFYGSNTSLKFLRTTSFLTKNADF